MYAIFEQLCKERNITPYKFCKDTGITTATISNWKAGRYIPKMEKRRIIADYFGVSLEYLDTGEDLTHDYSYYLDKETAETAKKMKTEDPVVLDAYRSDKKDRFVAFAKKLMELDEMEKEVQNENRKDQ